MNEATSDSPPRRETPEPTTAITETRRNLRKTRVGGCLRHDEQIVVYTVTRVPHQSLKDHQT
jgi:hypothetical protein